MTAQTQTKARGIQPIRIGAVNAPMPDKTSMMMPLTQRPRYMR